MKATTMRRLRQLHLYAAVFFAPAIIFFGFSGILQTYGFHETKTAPGWIKVIASLHQHQRLHRPERPKPAGPALTAVADHDHPDHDRARGGDHDAPAPAVYSVGLVGLKLFTGLMGLGLVIASALGIAIALGTRSTRRVSSVMLVLGLVLPAAFVLAL